MYARVTLLEIDILRIGTDSAVELYRREVMPELKLQPGYQGAIVLSTPEGKGLILTFWETEQQASAGGETGFYPDLLERYVTLFRSAPGRERYEVALAEMPTLSPT